MGNKKVKNLISTLLGLVIIIGCKNFNTNDVNNKQNVGFSESKNVVVENKLSTKSRAFEGETTSTVPAKENYKYPVSDTHNAYVVNKKINVPFNIGRYETYHTGDLNPVYENARQEFDFHDDRKNWGDTEYQDHIVNGNIYDYTGEFRNKYYINKRTLHKYKQEFYHDWNEIIYEKRYKHHYRGTRWWNILFTKTHINDSESRYPNFDNFRHTRCEQVNGRQIRTVFHHDHVKTIYDNKWRVNPPFNWPWDPKWVSYDSKVEYSLSFDSVLKWNPNALQSFHTLAPIKINTSKFYGLHLAQWNDISNIKNKDYEVTSYLDGRVDYFYFNTSKIIKEIYREADRVVDEYIRTAVIDRYIQDKTLGNAINLLIDVAEKCFEQVPIIGEVISIISIVMSVINMFTSNSGEDKRNKKIEKSKDNLYNKLREETLSKYKYVVFKVDPFGIDLDFFDKKNNSRDNVNEITLSYKENKKINGSVSCYSFKNFSNIYGYPKLFNDLNYFKEEAINVLRKRRPNIGKDLNDLVKDGTYPYL